MKKRLQKAVEQKAEVAPDGGDDSVNVTLSLRVPRDMYRKIEKTADAIGISLTDAFLFFTQKGCKQPGAKRGKKGVAA